MAFFSQKSKTGVSTVETNRDQDPDWPSCRDQLFLSVKIIHHVKTRHFFSRSRFLKSRLWCVKIFVEIVEMHQDCQDLSRRIKICQNLSRPIEICWEISTLSRPFESENDEKSWRIEKSRQENANIHALFNQDWEKLSRNANIFRSWQISQPRSRLFGLDIDVKVHFLKMSRFSWLSRLTHWQCWDQDSQSRQIETPRLTKKSKISSKMPFWGKFGGG